MEPGSRNAAATISAQLSLATVAVLARLPLLVMQRTAQPLRCGAHGSVHVGNDRIRRALRLLTQALVALAATYVLASAVRAYARRYYLFLPDYVRWSFTPSPAIHGTKHIFVLFTDHFEPDSDVV